MVTKGESLFVTLIILILFVIYYLVIPAQHPLWGAGELQLAEIGREMRNSHDWRTAHFLGTALTSPHIAGFWLNALGQMIFGHTVFAVRFSSVLCVVLSAVLIYRLGRRMWGDRYTSMMASVIFLTSLLVYQRSSVASLDPMMSLWLVLSMSACWGVMEGGTVRKRVLSWGLIALATAAGWLTGGTLSVMVPLLSLLPWCAYQRRLRALVLIMLLVALTLGGLGYLTGGMHQPGVWGAARTEKGDSLFPSAVWKTGLLLLCGSLPWAALLPGACCAAWQKRRQHTCDVYLLSWLAGTVLANLCLQATVTPSLLACFAPMALMVARYAVRLSRHAAWPLQINAWINIVLGLVCAGAVGVFLFPTMHSEVTLYGVREAGKVMLLVTALLGWCMTGAIALLPSSPGWGAAAFCPLALALIAQPAMPDGVTYAMRPHAFISEIRVSLIHSRFILTDNTTMAAGLAWELQRADILWYGDPGNNTLPAGEAPLRPVSAGDFPRWLSERRHLGNVTVILSAMPAPPGSLRDSLPEPDSRLQMRGQVAYFYHLIPWHASPATARDRSDPATASTDTPRETAFTWDRRMDDSAARGRL